jgi:multiple sugar transport system substrate-binding protein
MAVTRRGLVGAFGALGTIGSAAALASACSQTPSGGGAPAATGRAPVTLRWSPWDGEGQAIVDGANKGTDLYRQSHPHVTFEYIGQTGDFNPKIDAMIAAGDGPDVFGGNGASWLNRAKQGQFLGLDPYVKKDLKAGWRDDYVPAHLAWFSLKETGQFSLPMYLGTMALYYNKGWFRSKGVALPDANWSWDNWTEAMQKLTERPTKYGVTLTSLLSPSRVDANLIRANGGLMVDPNDDTKCVIDQPASLAALQWHHDRTFKDRYAMPLSELPGTGGTTPRITQGFSAGTIAGFVEGSWRLAPMALEVPAGVEWDIALVPKKTKRSTLATTDGWAVYRGTKSADEAWEFMRWLQGDDWYEIMMGTVGLTPARISQLDKWTSLVLKAYPVLQGKNVQAFTAPAKEKWADPSGFFRYHQQALDVLNPVFNSVLRDGEGAVDVAFKEATRQVNAVQAQLKASTGG